MRARTATRFARRRLRDACRASRHCRARPPPCTRSRPRARSRPSRSRNESMQSSGSPSRHRVTGSERVGPYTLLRLERGALEPGVPGQFFMLEAPGRLLPRPFSLCFALPGELVFLVDPIGPGTKALCRLRAGDEIGVLGPLGHGYRLDVERPLLVGGGVGIAPPPDLRRPPRGGPPPGGGGTGTPPRPSPAEQLGGDPPVVLGFRSVEYAEAAALLPG